MKADTEQPANINKRKVGEIEEQNSDKNSLKINISESTNIATIWIDSDEDGGKLENIKWHWRHIQSLTRKFNLQNSHTVNEDEDCNTEDEQILFDKTKLRCELLKSIRDVVLNCNK